MLTQAEQEMYQTLQGVGETGYQVPDGGDPYLIVQEILDHLGSPHAELRDRLGYTVLSQWIYRQRLLTPSQLHQIYTRVISSDMWFSHIGEQGTNSVLLRSFSSLTVALLLLVDADEPFLQQEEWEALLDITVRYCEQELDFRGYLAEAGWAHAAAHVADVINVFAKHPKTTSEHVPKLLQAIQVLIDHANEVFVDEEDERLARPINHLVQAQLLSIDELCQWLESVSCTRDEYLSSMYLRINWKHFARSLVFQLEGQERFPTHENRHSLLALPKRFTR